MTRRKRVLSSLLMAAGIVLVFYGFSSALGFTLVGMLASIAAIVSLLYAGGVIFGEAPQTHADPAHTDRTPERETRTAGVRPS